jgi:YD repeat-containing protein
MAIATAGAATYSYDAQNRLSTANNGDGTGVVYNYDPAGSLLSQTALATQTINFSPISNTVIGSTPIVLPVSSTGGLPITYTVQSGPASISNNVLTILGVGTVTLLADQVGDTNFATAQEVTNTFIVSKETQSIAFPPIDDRFYSTNPFIIVLPVASSGLSVTNTVTGPITLTGNSVKMLGMGTVTMAVFQAGNSNYLACLITNRFIIGNGVQTVSFTQPLSPQIYSTNGNFGLTATAPGGAVTFTSANTNVVSILGTNASIVGSGTVVITANQAGNLKYHAAFATRTVVISKAAQKISFPQPPSPQAYSTNGSFGLTATAPGGAVTFTSSRPTVVSITGSTALIKGAGTAAITATQAGSSNYLAATATNTVTISKATQTINFTTTKTASLSQHTFPIGAASSGLPVIFTSSNGSILTISASTATMKAKGTVTIKATQAGNANWLPATNSATITVQ